MENHTDYVGKPKTRKAYKLLKYKEFGPVGEWLSIGLQIGSYYLYFKYLTKFNLENRRRRINDLAAFWKTFLVRNLMGKKSVNDPVEAIVAQALDRLGMAYIHQLGPAGLDFYLKDHDLHIEVKQFHTPRIAEQMGRADNVIAIQGVKAAQLFAKLITNQIFDPVA